MRDVHGLAAGRNEFRPRGAAAGRMETVAVSGLNCDLFRNARAIRAVSLEFCDLSNLTAVEAVRLIAKGELRAEEYALRLLERYRALQSLNAVTWMDEERVLESARAIDQRRARGESLAALGGLPVIIKDNIDVAGTPTTAGSAIFARNVRHTNATVAQRLFDAGAVFFGKANMHELACGGTTSNPTTGICENPYDRRRIPGGSSGGTAAAIAARLVPAGLGTDTIGSIRIPAALCGTAGLRPTTWGGKLYSDDGVLPLASDLDTAGPMARTVADVALLHAAITGRPHAPACDLRTTRIGVPSAPYWEGIDPEIARVAQNALIHLQAAGATLVDVDAGAYFALASEAHATLLIAGMQEDLPRYVRSIGANLALEDLIASIASPDSRANFERAARTVFSPAQVEEARGASRRRAAEAYAAMFAEHRLAVIVFPTQPMPAPLIEPARQGARDKAATDEAPSQVRAAWDAGAEPATQAGQPGQFGRKPVSKFRNTHVTGVLGVPGLSIPAGLTAHGLPVGLEFDALAGYDSELLALGIAVELAWPKIPAPQPIA